MDEVKVLQKVATRILLSHEIEEILLTITHETLHLLDADICGVLLRDGDQIVMKACVGNDTVDTARLRMRRGEGLAGRVFATGKPFKVDDYLHSETISQDFFPLARLERAHCALGAPMWLKTDMIGVLEVWRRRASVFTEWDSRRLVTLANLATIAIENARLYEALESSAAEVTQANVRLQDQYAVIRKSGATQRELIQSLLDGKGLQGIARMVAAASGGEVALLGKDLEPLAVFPRRMRVRGLTPVIGNAVKRLPAHSNSTITVAYGKRWLSLRQVTAGADQFGWVCMVGDDRPDEAFELTITQAALTAALSHIEQRAASRARAAARDEILWDLLHGSIEVRKTAISRAQELGIKLDGGHRVFHCVVRGLDGIAKTEGWGTHEIERIRASVRDICRNALGSLKLLGGRGDKVVAIAAAESVDQANAMIRPVVGEIERKVPGIRVHCGISGLCHQPLRFADADQEAALSVLAISMLGVRAVVAYDELGVLGLLLAVRQDAASSTLIGEVLRPVLDYDAVHQGTLSATLRAYFDNDCSQREAAKTLRVHCKTVRYRLDQVEKFTSLDLSHHEDRVRLDLALRIHGIANSNGSQ